jgi:hypothetical protein
LRVYCLHVPERPVLESASPVPGYDTTILKLLHQYDRVQDSRYCSGSNEGSPNNGIGSGHVVKEFCGTVQGKRQLPLKLISARLTNVDQQV